MVGKASVPGQWRFSCVRFARMPGLATKSAPYGLITRPPSVLTRIWGKKAGTLIGYLSRMWPSSHALSCRRPARRPRGNLSRGWRSERRLPHVLARRKSRCCLVHDCGAVNVASPRPPITAVASAILDRYAPEPPLTTVSDQRSMAIATPIPPPMHRLASPFFASRRTISCSKVTRIRQPEAPIG